MPALAIILIIIGIALLFTGIFVEAVKFLLFVGIAIIVLAVIAWLMRSIRNKT
ncbi:hypothetical protein [Microbacterium thalli]|uniref:Flagellar biosynthesis protein FlhA n=1 Tax=Microbacterium thalli TaxID=3027921 RepID=A0ABT5SIL5_9MICO|nr:hypothetical protein [Microbacterium thalli]MDD7929862.1 hypothetical protein [Microbacterium thalli]MDD7962640.1 hypothetical protein [Microbacterium thalli]MDN8550173.1 hypothetical protein [Microbacterium thalli]